MFRISTTTLLLAHLVCLIRLSVVKQSPFNGSIAQTNASAHFHRLWKMCTSLHHSQSRRTCPPHFANLWVQYLWLDSKGICYRKVIEIPIQSRPALTGQVVPRYTNTVKLFSSLKIANLCYWLSQGKSPKNLFFKHPRRVVTYLRPSPALLNTRNLKPYASNIASVQPWSTGQIMTLNESVFLIFTCRNRPVWTIISIFHS